MRIFTIRNLAGALLLAASVGWLFLIPLLPMQTSKSLSAALLPKNHGPYALVFFGYAGCGMTCPPNLAAMAAEVEHMADVELVFVNLLDSATPEFIHSYASHFSPRFITYTPNHKPIQQAPLVREFGIKLNPSRQEVIDHSSQIYLLEKSQDAWQMRVVYPTTDTFVQRFAQDLQNLKN